MKRSVEYTAGFALLFLTSMVTISAGYPGDWYFAALFGAAAGLVFSGSKTLGVVISVGSPLAAVIYIVFAGGSASMQQASLLAGIIGVPGGYAVVLALTLIIIYSLAFLGYLAGSSFEIISGKGEKAES